MKKRNIVKTTAFIVFTIALTILVILSSGCVYTESESANRNINMQAQYFECERRITVYNARTDTIILEMEGYINVSNNEYDELVVTCKVGQNEYKKNYVYLNEYTLYVVEDITGTHTDPYHYKMYFHAPILPEVEVKP